MAYSSIRSSASKTSGKGAKAAAGTQDSMLKTSMSSLSIQQGSSDANGSGNNAKEPEEQVVVFLVSIPALPPHSEFGNVDIWVVTFPALIQCEQVSHHPPISSAYYACPSKGIEMTCVDQISAKVSGMSELLRPIFPCHRLSILDDLAESVVLTRMLGVAGVCAAVQVTPGEANKGLFIGLKEPSLGAGEVSRGCAERRRGRARRCQSVLTRLMFTLDRSIRLRIP